MIEWNKLDKEEKEVGWNTCVRNTKEGKESFFCGENRPSYKKDLQLFSLTNSSRRDVSFDIHKFYRGPDFGQGQTLHLLPCAVVMEWKGDIRTEIKRQ